ARRRGHGPRERRHGAPVGSRRSRSLGPGGSCPCREEQSHTAQFQRSVVIHYCWHPLVGQQLTVKSIQRAPDGQRAFRCLLPDGTWTFLPEWMTSREQCARLMLVDDRRRRLPAPATLAELLTRAAVEHAVTSRPTRYRATV